MGFLDSLKSEGACPANPANPANGGTESSLPIRDIREIRKGADVEEQPARLRSLAKLADCPVGYVDRLHPVEVADYAHYPDAETVASLRHLAACRECRERQCRPVTCATCARFHPDALNPEAGMGQCADGFGSDGPATFPSAPRHCQAWRAAT